MGSLSFLLIAGLLMLATGCPRGTESSANAAPAPAAPPPRLQPVPNDSGVLNDALVRDASVRDATTVRLDSGNGRDASVPRGPL
jgi:hypothetical protein